MQLPTFLCIGAPKCGTTWLYDCLKQHPDVFLPDTKELHFFNRIMGEDLYTSKGPEWYAAFYANASPHQARGDITPFYMREPYVPARIKQTLPNSKMIVLLRDPANRAYSEYCMWSRRWSKKKLNYTFDQLVQNPDLDRHLILYGSRYAEQIGNFLEYFSSDRILFLFTEEIKADPQRLLRHTLEFIGVNPSFTFNGTSKKSNQASRLRNQNLAHSSIKFARFLSLNNFDWLRQAIKRTSLPTLVKKFNVVPDSYPPLSPKTRQTLIQYYRADVLRLSEILKSDLSHWLI